MRGHELITLVEKVPQLLGKCCGIGTKDEIPPIGLDDFVFVNTE